MRQATVKRSRTKRMLNLAKRAMTKASMRVSSNRPTSTTNSRTCRRRIGTLNRPATVFPRMSRRGRKYTGDNRLGQGVPGLAVGGGDRRGLPDMLAHRLHEQVHQHEVPSDDMQHI